MMKTLTNVNLRKCIFCSEFQQVSWFSFQEKTLNMRAMPRTCVLSRLSLSLRSTDKYSCFAILFMYVYCEVKKLHSKSRIAGCGCQKISAHTLQVHDNDDESIVYVIV